MNRVHDALRLGASPAYRTLLAIAPVLFVATGIDAFGAADAAAPIVGTR